VDFDGKCVVCEPSQSRGGRDVFDPKGCTALSICLCITFPQPDGQKARLVSSQSGTYMGMHVVPAPAPDPQWRALRARFLLVDPMPVHDKLPKV
jgi:hypothetical protein